MRNSDIQATSRQAKNQSWWKIWEKITYFISLNLLLLKIQHTLGLGSTLYLSFSVSGCLCLCIRLFVSVRLGQCHHQMISFQKIYGLHGLEHHTMEINGDVTLGYTRTDGHVNTELEFCEHNSQYKKHTISFKSICMKMASIFV